MEFRLTYEGLLLSTQKDPVGSQRDPRANNKRDIRKAFHHQLKRLWNITPFLRTGQDSGPTVLVTHDSDTEPRTIEKISKLYNMYGFNFVPLVMKDLNLICGLDILFLRPEPPGSVLQSGDIDNRLKTLFDALTIPTANERYEDLTPGPDEKPFFCLLEDDKLIAKVSVETDTLLQSVSENSNINDARLVITVRLRPYELTLYNLPFG